jgi:hypothetical protein
MLRQRPVSEDCIEKYRGRVILEDWAFIHSRNRKMNQKVKQKVNHVR